MSSCDCWLWRSQLWDAFSTKHQGPWCHQPTEKSAYSDCEKISLSVLKIDSRRRKITMLLQSDVPWSMLMGHWMSPLNITIHHPTIRYMVYSGYDKVMSNIPKMGQLPTPDAMDCFFVGGVPNTFWPWWMLQEERSLSLAALGATTGRDRSRPVNQ